METIYTLKEVAEKLRLSDVSIRRYIKAGKLRAIKVGNRYRILERNIVELLEKNKGNK